MVAERILGRRITGVEVYLPRIVRSGDLRSLIGARIRTMERFGKYLKISLSSRRNLFAHMKMTGTLLWSGDLTAEPSHIRAALRFKRGDLLFRDLRTLGALWVLTTGETPWKKMGVDPLTPQFNPAALKALLAGRRLAVKQALLDQALVAGIGNIYASEALFYARVHPARAANSLSLNECRRLQSAVVKVLQASLASGGTTFRDFKLSDGREGSFKSFLKVYGKDGDRCPRCGSMIRKLVQGNRSTYLCPNCQK